MRAMIAASASQPTPRNLWMTKKLSCEIQGMGSWSSVLSNDMSMMLDRTVDGGPVQLTTKCIVLTVFTIVSAV
jgi:hypothetical protein